MTDGSTGTTAELEPTRERTALDLTTAVISVIVALPMGLLGFVGVMKLDEATFFLGLAFLGSHAALALLGSAVFLFRRVVASDRLARWGWLAIAAALGGVPALARALGASWGSERTEGGLVAAAALGLALYGVGNLQDRTGAGPVLRGLGILTWLMAAGYVGYAIAR